MEPAPVDPVDAASALLVRDGADGLEVLVVVRAAAMAFMGGATAFPGGRVDLADRLPGDDAAGALRTAAIRETFEETGILLARRRGEDELLPEPAVAEVRDRWRTALLTGRATLAEVLAAERLESARDLLVPAAHWITPEDSPRRFDTRFFIAAAPDQAATLEGSEHAALTWITPGRALDDAAAGIRTLPLATHTILTGLALSADVAAALGAARTRRIEPVLVRRCGRTSVRGGSTRTAP